MADSSMSLMLLLAVFVGAALALATRYHTDHPLHDLMRWIDEHHWHRRR
ncbi:hypothetical protein WKR88_27855 [Trinickia caryophylli]|uniref:Uncharacterized protein n=1 Tax=Trinickia caryophylli TaxID=28094 RepID=A0A1X7GZU6_TRICW|nr:hypothetical protein [Trinickia caryophylli]WQE11023.1 hypothetical protein U0034_14780 [Trinickia caryophylli]GLU35359.1 hypothetical protein Busp01_52010 [Trinickia caryophylli]SMF77010.1 hypothetical protein SAMN06295900_11998 [Trinickia caryophylli]